MQLFSRPEVLQSVMLSLFSFPLVKNDPASSSSSSPPSMVSIGQSPEQHQTKETLLYHEPPKGSVKDNEEDEDSHADFYDDNWTVFGKILRGESPAITYAENDHLLAFEDMHPRAPLHALIIPKRFIGSVFDLDSSSTSQSTSHQVPDLTLLEEMQNMAELLLKEQHPVAYEQGDYTLCFHIPPFNSVDHLHLHVLAPASKMKTYFRFVKYQTGTVWCTSLIRVLERLRTGKTAVPYSRPSRKTPLVDFLY